MFIENASKIFGIQQVKHVAFPYLSKNIFCNLTLPEMLKKAP
jgi:hypothetical protein